MSPAVAEQVGTKWWGDGPPPTERWPGVTIPIDDVGGKYRFDPTLADRVCAFFPRFCSHSKGEFAGQSFQPIDYQVQLILRPIFGWVDQVGLRRFRKAFIEIPKKNGKALALDTPIPTPAGWTTMGALAEGDVVFDDAGNPTRVSWASPVMLGRPCYRLGFSDGSSLVADAEHQWLTRTLKPEHGHAVATTEEISRTVAIRADGARNHSIDVHGPLQLPDAELAIPPYALGVWLGDGHTAAAAISGSREDLVIIDEIEQSGMTVGRVRFRDGRHPNVFHASRIEGMQRCLRRAGLLGDKHIPTNYLRASHDQRLALLQGIMDTDGHCTKRGQCELVTVKTRLRDDYLELIRTLGFKPTLVTDRARIGIKDCGERYRIQFWAFADTPVFRLPRKRCRQRQAVSRRARSKTVQIVSCEPIDSVPVKCITVEASSSLYLAGHSMIVTHNTQLIAGLALYMLLCDNEPGAEVYVAAADREQARILFDAAKTMVESNQALAKRLIVFRNRIERKDDRAAFFQVLSREAATKHGPNIHCLIIDELHAQPDRDLFETLTRGVIARRQPLILLITTAGDDDESICYEEYDYARRVLSGTVTDERHLPVIFEATGRPRLIQSFNSVEQLDIICSCNLPKIAPIAIGQPEHAACARHATKDSFLTETLNTNPGRHKSEPNGWPGTQKGSGPQGDDGGQSHQVNNTWLSTTEETPMGSLGKNTRVLGTSNLGDVPSASGQLSYASIIATAARKLGAYSAQPVIVDSAFWETLQSVFDLHSNTCSVRTKAKIDNNGLTVQEDWTSPELLTRVNPGVGTILKIETLLAGALEAANEPRKRNDFLRFHTNRWTNQATAWIPVEWWDACQGDLDDATLLQLECAAGLDLAQKWDLACFCPTFRRWLPGTAEEVTVLAEEADGKVEKKVISLNYELLVRPYFWIPENTMREHEKKDGVPYSLWAEQGLVTATEGDIIDYSRIYSDITTKIVPRYPRLKEGMIGYDPAFATDLATKLRDIGGLKVMEVLQNYKMLSEPAQIIEALIKGKRVHHDGHRVLRWCWENASVKTDDAGRIRPVKPKRASKRVDGAIAMIMGQRALSIDAPKPPQFQMFTLGNRR